MDQDSLARAAADGDNPIRKGSWSAQGVERRLEVLEFMIEGWPDPLLSVEGRRITHPWKKATAEDVEAMKAGVKNCRKLLSRLRGLMEEVPTPTLKSSIKTGSQKLQNPPTGWLPERVADHEKKVREKLVEIDGAIRALNELEDSSKGDPMTRVNG
jgi:hypothetical protein